MSQRQPTSRPNRPQTAQGTGSIQIALDATDHSQLLIENLHRYLRTPKAGCGFLYVLPPLPGNGNKFLTLEAEARQETVRVVNQAFDDYSETLAAHGWVVNTRSFVDADPTIEDSVLEHLIQTDCPLVVLGMHERYSSRRNWHTHSTASAIATHTPCSVLVIKQAVEAAMPLKVLFATDGSEHAWKALDQMIRLFPAVNTRVSLVSAISVNAYTLPLVEPFVNYTPLERAMRGETQAILNKTANKLRSAGFEVDQQCFEMGDPVDQILEMAESVQADLIVVGSHGQSNRVKRWFLGSVSSKVLEESPVSVAILK